MSIHVLCHARKTAVVCLLLALVSGLFVSFTSRASARARGERAIVVSAKAKLGGETRALYPLLPMTLEGGLLAYPPRPGAKQPMSVVYLHGVHGRSKNGCPWLRAGASEHGWLVCPEANVVLPDGSTSWGGTTSDQLAVVERAKATAKAHGATDETMLIGFSQGAYLALDLVRGKRTPVKALVLLGADVTPTAAELRAAGVRRVVLGAGTNDGSFGTLARAAETLDREGFEVRFVDLGRVGHTYVAEEPALLSEAIAWAGRA